MRLADLVARYPTARLATPADNARILEFFERTPMRTSAFDVQYRRRPDFFQLLRFQSDRSFVIVSEDAGGAVRSVGTISLRPGWMGGRPTTIGYLGDLRIAYDRELARAWRRFFTELLTHAHDIDELADCTQWFTAVLDTNRAALMALRPRAGASRQPSLVPIAPFTMRNLIMRLPFAGRRSSGTPWRVSDARAADREALTAFFEDENRRSAFGFRGELTRRLSRWDGLSIDDFVIASDTNGIVACVAPWSPSAAKQTVVSRVPAPLRLLGRGARALPSPPLRIPEPGDALRSPYLTHLTFAARLTPDARAQVFRRMLDHLFDRWRGADWHCVALCDFAAWNLGRALGGYLQQVVPITVYAVVPPGHADETIRLDCTAPPAFEMAMV
jgi:hypothetical protein